MKSIVVVIEGVDSVGKTTLSKRISEELSMFYLYTPQLPLSSVRKEVEALRNFKTRFFYYLASVIAVQDLINEKLESGISVVIDRYIYSTFVMHKHLGVDISCVSMRHLPIKWPDVGLLLTANTKVREKRKDGRGEKIKHDTYIEQMSAMLDKAQNGYKEFPELCEINTDFFTENKVFDTAVALIEGKRRNKK